MLLISFLSAKISLSSAESMKTECLKCLVVTFFCMHSSQSYSSYLILAPRIPSRNNATAGARQSGTLQA